MFRIKKYQSIANKTAMLTTRPPLQFSMRHQIVYNTMTEKKNKNQVLAMAQLNSTPQSK